MKRSFFLNIVLIICAFLSVVSCTYDTDISYDVTKETDVKQTRAVRTMEVLIEYRKGTSEYNKEKVRGNYIRTGLLLSWEECEIKDNDDVEVWVINAEIYYAKDPAPLTNPDKEDMDKVTLNANCKDYN
ncbi:hypothetical protein [Aquimarina sp. Aq78]|uniref:hypothetical protein n=1 Tax=Aquimarina sp. Aq78 TaxID=1191889 RepID=UPI000D0FDA9C|nr:hypothetical protein [Aquimarina sp. Aq78]